MPWEIQNKGVSKDDNALVFSLCIDNIGLLITELIY